MLEKLKLLEKRYQSLQSLLEQQETLTNRELYAKTMQEYKSLTPAVEAFREYQTLLQEEEDAKELLATGDAELCELAKDEIREVQEKKEQLYNQMKVLLLPKDPNDDKNVIIEIRGGAGGDEAALFSGVLFRMYSMYAEQAGFRCETINANETELGGFKEVSFSVSGLGAFSRFKYESGVHRVQRVPETEAAGRIHTSTVTVAVLPEAEEVHVNIDPNDLEITAHRASGAGGQHVNKPDSAIRILHRPTGIVVECQDERSQFKNRDRAMKVLRAKIYEQELSKQTDDIAARRKNQVGSGDRSERIRTYNYPQGRVTDHRIGLTLYDLENVLNGKLDRLIDELASYEKMQLLQQESE